MRGPGYDRALFISPIKTKARRSRRICAKSSYRKCTASFTLLGIAQGMINMTRLAALTLTAVLLAAPEAWAQAVLPSVAVPDASHVLAPPAVPPMLAPRPPRTEPAPELPGVQDKGVHYHFAQVRIAGAGVVPADSIAALFDGLTGQDVSPAALKTALDAVNALYLRQCYPLGRAYVPAQVIHGGTLVVRVVEGYVEKITVLCGDDKARALVTRIAQAVTRARPLTSRALERTMLLIQDLPGITVGSKFDHMNPQTGGTTLVVSAAVKPLALGLYLDNRANLDALPFQPYLTATMNNLLGWGDQISLTALLSPRQKDYAFYSLSVSRWISDDGLTAGVNASWAQALDNRSLPPYDLRSLSSQLSGILRYPLMRATAENLNLQGRLYYTSASYALQHFSFAKDKVTALEAGGDYARAFSDSLGLGADMYLAQGFGGAGRGGHTRAGADGSFTKLRGHARLIYKPAPEISLIVKTRGQYSGDSLFASEEVTFGGLNFGRGFGTSEAAGDSGFGLSFQPEYTLALDMLGWGLGWSLTPYVFSDYAKTYNTRGDGQADAELVSAGGGLRIGIAGLTTLTLELDKPLGRVPLYRHDRNFRFYAGFEIGVDRALQLIGGSP